MIKTSGRLRIEGKFSQFDEGHLQKSTPDSIK